MIALVEYVDSIGYYGRELDAMNDRVAGMQHEKIALARTGNDSARASQWISHAIDRVSTAAESTLVRRLSFRAARDKRRLSFSLFFANDRSGIRPSYFYSSPIVSPPST